MISVEAWTTIRYLKVQGLGTRTIAKEVGVARNTVRHALRSEGPPGYKRPPRPNPKLELFREEARRMLTNDHFIGSRIFKELRKRGYDGSQMAFYRFLNKIKAEEGKTKACSVMKRCRASRGNSIGLPTPSLSAAALSGWWSFALSSVSAAQSVTLPA